jgi:DNA-binding transcriptional LysR family regulator
MHTEQLRHFCATVEAGTITQASELLRLTPGGLSRSIKRLEKELGTQLFIPSGRNLTPTEAGRRFYAHSFRILADLDAARQAAREPQEASGLLRLASFEVFTGNLMVRVCKQEFPERRVRMRELVPGAIEQAVRNREVDFGITYVPFPEEDLSLLRVGVFRMAVFVRRGAFLGQKMEELPFSTPITAVSHNRASLESLDGWPVSRPRRVQYEFETLVSSIEACRLGVCAVHLPEFVAALANEGASPEHHLVRFGDASARSRPIAAYIVKRASAPEDSVLKRMARGLRRHLAATP